MVSFPVPNLVLKHKNEHVQYMDEWSQEITLNFFFEKHITKH